MPAHAVAHRTQRSTYHQKPLRPIRVLLVDDHFLVRQALRKSLDRFVDINLVGEAANGEEAVKQVDRLKPAVVVMDINMPGMDGIEATGRIMRKHPDLHVIGLSFNVGKKNQEAMSNAGAHTLLDKGAAHEQLYRVISQAVSKVTDASSSGMRHAV
ncbi:MAG: response regulator transcription factor [Nitrospira sp.]|jgi:DNA-binding NarL/FixJ family response regulator